MEWNGIQKNQDDDAEISFSVTVKIIQIKIKQKESVSDSMCQLRFDGLLDANSMAKYRNNGIEV